MYCYVPLLLTIFSYFSGLFYANKNGMQGTIDLMNNYFNKQFKINEDD